VTRPNLRGCSGEAVAGAVKAGLLGRWWLDEVRPKARRGVPLFLRLGEAAGDGLFDIGHGHGTREGLIRGGLGQAIGRLVAWDGRVSLDPFYLYRAVVGDLPDDSIDGSGGALSWAGAGMGGSGYSALGIRPDEHMLKVAIPEPTKGGQDPGKFNVERGLARADRFGSLGDGLGRPQRVKGDLSGNC